MSWKLAATLTGILLLSAPVAAQDQAETIGEPAANGARIVDVRTVSGLVTDLTIESPSVGTVETRLLLPASFAEGGTFPTLYLLHGGGGGFDDWTQETRVGLITAGTDLLVAMPAAASSNLGTWLPEGGPDARGGPPNWERFHLEELPELLERNWRAADERAVAGLSLGGYGSVMYAARHPELFEGVASFSGVLDLSVGVGDPESAVDLSEQVAAFADSMGWTESNPINLVNQLEGVPLYISYGNGEPGPLDAPDADFDRLESWVGGGADSFTDALAEAGIDAAVHAYGPGSHSWPYWERELATSLPFILESLGLE